MARVNSTMVSLGTKAQGFNLPDTVSGKNISLPDVKGDVATVVMFICNHCPFVIHINDELVKLANDYRNKGVGFVAISANDIINHPHDAPDKMKETALHLHYTFPYLYDESQDTAKAYDAACTPDFFIYDKNLQLVYRGQLDDSRPGNEIPITGKDIRYTLDCLISNKEVPSEQRPSIGCNIKWK
jgi:thiol-disulfide isomerase/thioredoxin